jgi:hypothetical protein
VPALERKWLYTTTSTKEEALEKYEGKHAINGVFGKGDGFIRGYATISRLLSMLIDYYEQIF